MNNFSLLEAEAPSAEASAIDFTLTMILSVANFSRQMLLPLLLQQIYTLTGSLFAGQNGQINLLLQTEIALLSNRLWKQEYIHD